MEQDTAIPSIAAPSCEFSLSIHHFAEALGEAVDIKDPYTHHHSQEIAVLNLLLARAIGLDEACCTTVHIAGHLHDLGKIGISDQVLQKNGPLTADEWKEIHRHPLFGYNILRLVPCLMAKNGIAEIVLCHHEQFNDGGYPQGLLGRDIPLCGRILAVADTISAMTGQRSYRGPRPWHILVDELRRVSGSQLDPFVIEAFFSVEKQIHEWLLGEVALAKLLETAPEKD